MVKKEITIRPDLVETMTSAAWKEAECNDSERRYGRTSYVQAGAAIDAMYKHVFLKVSGKTAAVFLDAYHHQWTSPSGSFSRNGVRQAVIAGLKSLVEKKVVEPRVRDYIIGTDKGSAEIRSTGGYTEPETATTEEVIWFCSLDYPRTMTFDEAVRELRNNASFRVGEVQLEQEVEPGSVVAHIGLPDFKMPRSGYYEKKLGMVRLAIEDA